MPLIVSSSGIRGTVEGRAGENLTPLDVVSWVGAWGIWIRRHHRGSVSLVVGQDARPSGALFRPLAIHTLRALGYEIHDIGLTTTPTLAMVIPHLAAQGGLILTASHNPSGWNALKFLDAAGEFLPPTAIEEIDALRKELEFSSTDHPGSVHLYEGALTYHLSTLVSHPWVCTHRIRQAQLRIVVDTINSSGGVFVPALLESLGVSEIRVLNGEPNGRFAHPPEPLPENLQDLAREVQASRAHVGIAVDPDVDRVAFYLPDGSPFGEEYTLVAVTDYILSHEKGPVVANQSTTAAVAWIANRYGVPFYESRVGEYYVVQKMKAVGAVIGGEGNGGIIWPRLHYGRDALVGIALFLSHLAEAGGDPVALRARYPRYVLLKAKMSLSSPPPSDFWRRLADVAADAEISLEDGLKLRWAEKWIHLRASATEPLLRLIAEAPTQEETEQLIHEWRQKVVALLD